MNDLRKERGAGNLQMILGLPYVPLAVLPTPVDAHPEFAASCGMAGMFVKRDDRTHPRYGGNKVRKLGFLLAHALQQGYRSVVTFGGAGSNHAVATAMFARELGMRALLVLGPQHNSRHVRENLLCGLQSEAALYPCEWENTARTAARAAHDARRRDGRVPYIIPPGGSSPLGMAGYANAAFELRRQVEEGALAEPDVLYVASGTMGTCAGLALGLSAAGMKTRVTAVRVTSAPYTSPERARMLFQAANLLLHQCAGAFPLLDWESDRLVIRDEFYGDDYALFTPEGMAARRLARDEMGLQLEGTYTAKAFAAVVADARAGSLAGKNVLFWNTYAGDDTPLSRTAAAQDWHALPETLQHYFTDPLQPLDVD